MEYRGVYCFDLEFTPTIVAATPQSVPRLEPVDVTALALLPGGTDPDFTQDGVVFDDPRYESPVACPVGYRDAAVVMLQNGEIDNFSAVYVMFG